MNNTLKLFYYLIISLCLLTSCNNAQKKYIIGVSQCSEDSWRSKLQAELEQATYFNEDVELIMCSAKDNVEEQRRQIDSLVNLNVDLLVVSPQQLEKLSGSIAHATEKKIPVILFDRKSDVKDYTAFMGADNYKIGKMLGDFAAAQLGGKGYIVEITGEHGSSPAMERHRGFADALKLHPDMHVIACEEGDWKQPSGEQAMERILIQLEKNSPDFKIDLVFGGNDRMAVGARDAIMRYVSTHQAAVHRLSPNNIIYLGIDALPTPGGGIEKVRDGVLTASAIYPTHGDELMELALNILRGEPYEKVNNMETSIVTKDNANVLLLQHKEVLNQDRYIKKMHNRVDNMLSVLSIQRGLLLFIIFVVIVVSILLVMTVRAYRVKKQLIEQLQRKNEELNKEKETVERQRDLLEEQRDQLLDATTSDDGELDGQNQNLYQGPESDFPKNEFMEKFLESLEKRYTDAALSVEDIGRDLCLSRVQLYRKVKAVTGRTPVEIIREERLKRAHVLLADSTLSVSEIAYKVGFSAPSYFTKCYKEFYGKSPSDKQ